MAPTFQESPPVATWRSVERATAGRSRGTRSALRALPVREPDAATVLRLVSVFDDLVERGAGLDDVVRSVAFTTECAAGLSEPDGVVIAHWDRRGARRFGPEPVSSARRDVMVDGATVARLWIERESQARLLDELILARGACAVELIMMRMTETAAGLAAVPVLVERLIDGDLSVVGRSRACRQLGYQPHQPIRIAVFHADREPEQLNRLLRQIRSTEGARPQVTVIGEVAVLVMRATIDAGALRSAGGCGRLGLGPACPAIEAPRSYRRALQALRFTEGPGTPRTAHFDQLGSVLALAALADADLMDFPDWVALAELARTDIGLTAILTAEVLMRTGSQRDAAVHLHLHHSTIAHRVSHVERALGYGLGEHSNWFRAQLAIHLWRLTAPQGHAEPPVAPSARWRISGAEVPVPTG